MNDWYFYQENGTTKGPVPLKELHGLIRGGSIRVFDLIFKDGEEKWKRALDHRDLREIFQDSALATLRDRPWVGLRRKAPDAFEFTTVGPLGTEEVRQKIQSGDLSYSDYVWKDGLLDWMRIGFIEEFNPKLRQSYMRPPIPIPEPSAPDLISQVQKMKRPTLVQDLPPPVEEMNSELEPTLVSIPREVQPPEPETQRQRSRFHVWSAWGLPIGLTAILLAGSGYFYWFWWRADSADSSVPQANIEEFPVPNEAVPKLEPLKPTVQPKLIVQPKLTAQPKPVVQPDPVTQTDPMAQAKPIPQKPNLAKPEARLPRAPKELFLVIQNSGSDRATIEVRSDGTEEFPVFLQVIGMPGQVLEGGAFYRFMKLRTTGDLKRPLEISKLNLPQGKFIIKAETGDLKREAKLNLGTQNSEFKSAIVRQRKNWADAIWKERQTIWKQAGLLEKAIVQGLGPTKKFSSKGLDRILSVNRNRGGQYLMFEQWSALNAVLKEAKKGIQSSQLDRVQSIKDQIATFTVWK